jgi:hypothetical protein
MDELVGSEVVIDVDSPFVYMGLLESITQTCLLLKRADVHDLRDSTTTRDVYIREARMHGIQPNRRAVTVRQDRIISVSRLSDVIP